MLKSYHSLNYDLQFNRRESDSSLKILQEPFNQYSLLDISILPSILLNFLTFFCFQYMIYFNPALGLLEGLGMTETQLNWVWIAYYATMTITCFPLTIGVLFISRNIKLHLVCVNLLSTGLLLVQVFSTNVNYFGVIVCMLGLLQGLQIPLNLLYLTKIYPKHALEIRLAFIFGISILLSLGFVPLITMGLSRREYDNHYLKGYRINYLILFFIQLLALLFNQFQLPQNVYQLKKLTHINLKKLTQQLKSDFISLNFNFPLSLRQIFSEFVKFPTYALFVLVFCSEWLIKLTFYWHWYFMPQSGIMGYTTTGPSIGVGFVFFIISLIATAIGRKWNARLTVILLTFIASFVFFHLVAFIPQSSSKIHLGLNIIQFSLNWTLKALLINFITINSLGNHQTIMNLSLLSISFYLVNMLSLFDWFPANYTRINTYYPAYLMIFIISMFLVLGLRLLFGRRNGQTSTREQDPFSSYKYKWDQIDTLGFRYLI
ncbi:MFS general substrate transporter [Conidiobolus coronatus NRRL 28638]|uniref:MFS general substrate transporter n=1 Tax=Conidiobolus coronatus (strain ATCC 28846 / CBS 209.66 / NRRL 28638) TaxID=796925 RepID=A0A137NWW2_CONC2|nr:MFS general substrate transporter [Conidiobolus coronatus NRRL 28638]|eukprot:KXN67188.1 MFS general substrate transporter [Conidiobolus coronatus NRRL 28638]